jgi:hypothetical protein
MTQSISARHRYVNEARIHIRQFQQAQNRLASQEPNFAVWPQYGRHEWGPAVFRDALVLVESIRDALQPPARRHRYQCLGIDAKLCSLSRLEHAVLLGGEPMDGIVRCVGGHIRRFTDKIP